MLQAYHNDKSVKSKYVRRMAAHRKADELCQRVGWRPGQKPGQKSRGCSVGCLFHAYNHSRGPIEIGVPKAEAMQWPELFLKAIPVGADLSLVWPRFAVWLLSDEHHGVIRFAGGRKDVEAAIQGVATMFERVLDGESVEYRAADAADAAARAANAAQWRAMADSIIRLLEDA